MNTEKKLEYFADAVAREVDAKKRQAQSQMAAELNEKVAIAAAEIEAEAEAQNQAQLHAIQKVMHKRVTDAETESRRSLANLKERLTTQLFDSIKADITTITQQPEYEVLLIDNIQTAVKQSRIPYVYVQLSPKDMHLAEAIEKATSLKAEPDDTNDLGGFKLQTEQRNIAQDHTIAVKLREARQAFASDL